MDRFQVPVDKIREIIGSQGKVINDIIANAIIVQLILTMMEELLSIIQIVK